MKNNLRQIRTLAIIVLILILALAAIAGAYAKYTNELPGSDKARVAHWKINTNNSVGDLFAASYDNVTAGSDQQAVIAPGTSGSYSFDITGNVETAYTLKITATGTDEINDKIVKGYSPIKYSFSDGTTTSDNLTFDQLLAKINAIDTGATKHDPGAVNSGTYTIGWKWAFDGQSDENDTTIGNAVSEGDKTVSLNVNIVTTQVD